jgi:hypothetical protein
MTRSDHAPTALSKVPSCRSQSHSPPTQPPFIWCLVRPNRSPQHLSGTLLQSISLCGIFLSQICSLHFALVFSRIGLLILFCRLIGCSHRSRHTLPKPLAIAPFVLPPPLSSWHTLLIAPQLVFACPDLLMLLSRHVCPTSYHTSPTCAFSVPTRSPLLAPVPTHPLT